MQLHTLPALGDNYIWLLHGPGGVVVVDPGAAEPVLAAADSGGFQPAAVLLTHHHQDHIGGTPALRSRWPDLPVYAPADERIDCATHTVHDGQIITVGGMPFSVVAVPGHTRSHVAFFQQDPVEPTLFCGDTLFSLGCGRLFEGSAAQMHASLSRLAAFPDATRVCCGHEYTMSNAAFARVVEPDNPALRRRSEEAQSMRDAARPTLPSTIGDERACNPFLRCDEPAVRAAAGRQLGHAPRDAVETFAALRCWKDGFAA